MPGFVPLTAAFVAGAAVAGVAGLIAARTRRRITPDAERDRKAEHDAEVAAMTAGLAHEIKNPLSTIGMNAQLLGEAVGDLDLDEHERAAIVRRLGTLRRETDRLRDILSDFLEFAGEIRLATAPADLNDVVSELGDFFLPEAEKHRVRLRIDLAPGPLIAEIDTPRVKQALLNLMINATQAMADGQTRGELILRTGRDPAGSVAVHVIDTGPGIDPERRARIFEPYFTTKRGGSGLGLPTTRRIVNAHGGHIAVVSEPGRGTDFQVVLPAADAHPRPA